MAFFRKLLNVSILTHVLCVLGYAYQTFKISGLYFSYQTSTYVRHESLNNVLTHPAFTICMNKILLIKPELWHKFIIDDDIIQINERFNNLSIGEQFESLVAPETIFGCHVYSLNGNLFDCIYNHKCMESMNYNDYCLTLYL